MEEGSDAYDSGASDVSNGQRAMGCVVDADDQKWREKTDLSGSYQPLLREHTSSKKIHSRARVRPSELQQYEIAGRWHRLVLDPNHCVPLTVWDSVIAVLLILSAFVEPFEVALLDGNGIVFVFDHLMDTVFMIDLLLQFFVAYHDPTQPGNLERDQRKIIKNYLAGWFAMDLLSALPTEVFQVFIEAVRFVCMMPNSGRNDMRFLKLTRILRLLRITRLLRLLMRWQSVLGFSSTMVDLLKFVSVVVLCCHWMACIWAAMALQETEDNTWIKALAVAKGGPPELYEGAWQVYSIALYWAIVTITSIGYGDITPQTEIEYWAAAVCTSLMASIWAYVIGAVCSIVSTLNPYEMSFKRKMDDINWIMAERGMPDELCHKVRRYFHETRDAERGRTEQELIAQLSPKLQGEYAHNRHHTWIDKVWYLRNMDHEIILGTARRMTLGVYSPYEEVLQDRTIFIVQRGIAALNGKVFIRGDVWGEDMVLSNRLLRENNRARSLTYLFVLTLNVMDLVEVVAPFSDARARLRWSQVQIAIRRSVLLIARTMIDLEKQGYDTEGLDTEKRMELIGDILQGKFERNNSIPQDYLGLQEEDEYPREKDLAAVSCSVASYRSNDSFHEEEPGGQQSTEPSPRDLRLEKLASAVTTLGHQLVELSAKVDSIHFNCMKHTAASPSRMSRLADFGPVVRPKAWSGHQRHLYDRACTPGSQDMLDNSKAGKSRKQRVTCDACGRSPVQGKSFKCLVCANYDLCEACHDDRQTVHPGHNFAERDAADSSDSRRSEDPDSERGLHTGVPKLKLIPK